MTPTTCKAARSGLDLTQGDLAKLAKVHRRTVCNYENGGTQYEAATVKKIEAAFAAKGVTPSDTSVTFPQSR